MRRTYKHELSLQFLIGIVCVMHPFQTAYSAVWPLPTTQTPSGKQYSLASNFSFTSTGVFERHLDESICTVHDHMAGYSALLL
eukprot:jgi/Botrbrau1/6737/Bobra.0324s0023.1